MNDFLLTASGEELEGRVRKAFDGMLNGQLRRVDDTSGLLEHIDAEQPLVVAIGPSLGTDVAIDLAGAIDRTHPEVAVVLVTTPTPALWEQALRAGVRDVIAPDAALSDVRATFDRALQAGRRRRSTHAEPAAGPSSRLIAVVSPKGGAGKTAVATNLAVGLARLHPHEVVIVDLDLQFGDVANALRLTPEQTMTDAARVAAALDATTVKAYLTPHPTDLLTLCAPDSPADADDVSSEDATAILGLLAEEFQYVVVDTSAGLDEWTLAALEHATDVVLVAGTDVASARSMRKELEAFDLLGITKQQRHLVLNRADARVGLGAADIEATVGTSVNVAVPSSRAVPLSMNQGIPLLESAQRSPVSRSFGELVNRIAVPAATRAPQQGASSRFRRRKEPR